MTKKKLEKKEEVKNMDNLSCNHCNGLVTKVVEYGERHYNNIGDVRVKPDGEYDLFWLCESCGHVSGNYCGLEHLDEVARKIMTNRLMVMYALSENRDKEWIPRSKAAVMLGSTETALVKGKVKGSDMIYRISVGTDVLFNLRSIEEFKKTGSGLFPLACLYKQIEGIYDGEPEKPEEDPNVGTDTK